MLGKLFKYEMTAVGRILLPLFGALILVTVPATLINGEASLYNGNIMRLVITLLYMTFFFGTCVISMFIAVYRFKTNILGNEGYLMNTIPVSPMANVAAKLLTAVIYQVIGISIAIMSYFIFSKILYFSEISDLFSDLLTMSSETAVTLILMGLVALFGLTLFDIAAYASLSVGHSFSSFKMIISIGTFLVLWMAGTSVFGKAYEIIFANKSGVVYYNFQREALVWIIFEIAYGLIGLVLTNFFLKKRLNLN